MIDDFKEAGTIEEEQQIIKKCRWLVSRLSDLENNQFYRMFYFRPEALEFEGLDHVYTIPYDVLFSDVDIEEWREQEEERLWKEHRKAILEDQERRERAQFERLKEKYGES